MAHRRASLTAVTTMVACVALAAGLVAPAAAHDAGRARTRTPVKHIVVIVQENHSFDSYFARYCRARSAGGKRPACDGGPVVYPGTSTGPVVLDDASNGENDPNHTRTCQIAEIDGGKMDGYLTAPPANGTCGAPYNYGYAAGDASSPAAYYQQLIARGALADRYFQPVPGASSANDMYFWTTRFVFDDNDVKPDAIGTQCQFAPDVRQYDDTAGANVNLGKILSDAGVTWAWYAEGYADMRAAGSACPPAPPQCGITLRTYPCVFDPSDIPAEYFASSVDNPASMRDYSQLATDIAAGTLPSVVFVKPIGYNSEHPGYGTTISAGVAFVRRTIQAVERSKLGKDTLVLVAWDESGGYFDHVAPPATSTVDQQPYGPRLPLLAVGPFARRGAVSHRVLEHSSITKFIEWNWLKGRTGQLGGRDRTVHNLGSLLRPGLRVPS